MTNEAITIDSNTGAILNGSIAGGNAFLHVNHEGLASCALLSFGRSADGITITPIGGQRRYVPPVSASGTDSIRDPAAIEYGPTGEIMIAYTHVSAASSGYEVTIGLCKTAAPGAEVEFVTEIPVAGTGITPTHVWVGDWYVEDGHYYLTCLPKDAATWDVPGIGYIECLDPGTWTSWSSFTSLVSTNVGLSGGPPFEFNDVKVVKIDDTYHYFFDGYAAASGTLKTILHSTSSTLWTSITTPTNLSGIASLGIVGNSVEATAISIVETVSAHHIRDGETVMIAGVTGSTPTINGSRVATVIDETHFSVPVDVTVAGTGGTVSREFEGPIYAIDANGVHHLWMELVFAQLYHSTSDDLTTWTTPVEVNWPGFGIIGNGSVIRCASQRLSELTLNAPTLDVQPQFATSDSVITRTGIRALGDYFSIFVGSTLSGDGDLTGESGRYLQLHKNGAVLDGGVTGTWAATEMFVSGGNLTLFDASLNRLIMTNGSGTWFAPQQQGTDLVWYFNVAAKMTLTSSGALTLAGGLTHGSATLLTTTTALTNGAAAQVATMTNGPTAGNPTKWLPINDNGTTRYIPAW